MLIYSFRKLLTVACFEERKLFTFHVDDFSMNFVIYCGIFDDIWRYFREDEMRLKTKKRFLHI